MRRVVLLAIFASCSSEPRGPEAAFDRLRVAVGAQDAKLLYGALDSESRWAVESVWRYHRKIAEVVEAKVPPALRERELERVRAATTAAGPAEFFAGFAAAHGDPFAPLGSSAEALGSWARREGNTVVTSTGKVVPMAAGRDGAWGYAAFQGELVRWRDAASHDLARIEADVAGPPK
jgi:hypothetical protein